MAQRELSLDEDLLSCAICLDLLKDPVTIPCGHNYCAGCITNHWKEHEVKRSYSCPQCREVFTQRPAMRKNTMLAELVQEMKKSGPKVAPDLHLYGGPADVDCDFCTGNKLKATKSCLQCLASYCDLHLQPHYNSPVFKTHKLITASADIQENICSLHNKMEVFCRSDQLTICYLCSVDEHKGHDTVSAAAERTERQQELDSRRENIQKRIKDREENLKQLEKEGEAINCSADKVVKDVQTMFNQLLQLLQKRSNDVQQQIRLQQERNFRWVRELQQRMQQEISELTRRDNELKNLSLSEDHAQFLRRYLSLASPSSSTNPDIRIHSLKPFHEMMEAVTELIQKLQDTLIHGWTRIPMTKADPSLTPPHQHLASPQGTLSKEGSMELPPTAALRLGKSNVSATAVSPKLAKSKTVAMASSRLKSSESQVLPPQPYSKYSNIEPMAPIYRPSSESKTLKPTPDGSTVLSSPVYSKSEESNIGPEPPSYMSLIETFKAETNPEPKKSMTRSTRYSLPNTSEVSPSACPSPKLAKNPPPDQTKDKKSFPSPGQLKSVPLPAQSPPSGDPGTRSAFLSYTCQITLDPNTVNKMLVLSMENRKVTQVKKKQWYTNRSERFKDRFQVLSKESLTGRCYWEVEWTGMVSVAVAYKDVPRTGVTSGFGDNNMSWALYCHNNKFIHDGKEIVLSGPQFPRIGVYLDYHAGVLSFYSISTNMVLLHRAQVTFTQPLHVGISVSSGAAELLQIS
ncbi:E3 ubiquitin/ISG15 ligase TRIM25-like [Cyprinodon tularosa]|uniref:E3 ubiquitin/ISG15 ligase TRIM25-like n=1 Tax=Cyprinodon tularosa TaxID=77115 RepID=UPI0018E22BC8|nr:E3 ubiquitin/ISG15 ligase TRIM25-like [Cyprinodon tularosa]